MGPLRRSMLVVAIAIAVVATSLAAVSLLPPPGSRHPRTVRSEAGGYQFVLPKGWRAAELPHGRDLAGFERPLKVRIGADAWMWVNRWSGGGDSVADVERRSARWMHKDGRSQVRFGRATVGGRRAVQVDHRQDVLPFLAPGLTDLVMRRYQVPLEGQVFEIGVVGLAIRGIPEDADAAARAADFFAPTAGRLVVRPQDGFELRLPAGWNEEDPKPNVGAVLMALAPGTPAPGWIYVFSWPEPVEEAVVITRAAIEKHGGTGLVLTEVTHDGAPAVRFEFDFPNRGPEKRPPTAHDVELFVPRPGGGTLTIAIGHIDRASRVAEEVLAGFHTTPHPTAE